MAGLVLARVVDPVIAQQVVGMIMGMGGEMISSLIYPSSETLGI